MFTGLDFITVLFLLSGVLLGVSRGFLGTLLDLFSLALGILLAGVVYLAPVHLFHTFQITSCILDLILFVLTALILTFVIITLLEIWRKRNETGLALDRILGVIPGLVEGFILASGVLIIISSFSSADQEIQTSRTSQYVIRFLPGIYETAERRGLTLPKLIILPSEYQKEFQPDQKGMRFEKLNFAKLEGATCLKCRGKVHFEGYFPRNGAGLAPKFVCNQCHRTSDGCQTFEGFHLIYGTCPVDLAKKGQWFDCGNWPNYEWILTRGTCPVDNKKSGFWQWPKPVPNH